MSDNWIKQEFSTHRIIYRHKTQPELTVEAHDADSFSMGGDYDEDDKTWYVFDAWNKSAIPNSPDTDAQTRQAAIRIVAAIKRQYDAVRSLYKTIQQRKNV